MTTNTQTNEQPAGELVELIALLREVLLYDPETGIFTWKVSPRPGVQARVVAGAPHKHGYITITFRGKYYLAHRLAWAFTFGKWPTDQIDHVNRCRNDNRICNLREATPRQNAENVSIRKDNKSGFRGVRWDFQLQKWRAQITHKGRNKHLGVFADKDAACAAYVQAARTYHTRNEQAAHSIKEKS